MTAEEAQLPNNYRLVPLRSIMIGGGMWYVTYCGNVVDPTWDEVVLMQEYFRKQQEKVKK